MHRKILTYSTRAKSEIRTITADLRRCVAESGIRDGCLLAYSLHTTLGLMVQETAETHLCEDVLDYLGFVIEEDGELYKHRGHLHPRSSGEDSDRNAPSHLRQILVNQNVLLDVHDGELALGPWQDVAIAEFDGPRPGRNILVKIWADPGEARERGGDSERGRWSDGAMGHESGQPLRGRGAAERRVGMTTPGPLTHISDPLPVSVFPSPNAPTPHCPNAQSAGPSERKP